MKRRQKGMAVLMVLLLIAVMALLAVNASDRFMQAIRRTDSSQFMLQAKWSLLGAETWLSNGTLHAPRSLITQQLQLEEDLIHYRWFDRQACFNLNALVPRNKAAIRVFGHLLRNLSMSDEEAIALTQQTVQRVHRGPFSEASELRELAGVSLERWHQLQPLVCVLPPGQLQINVNGLTAQQLPLLRALFEGSVTAENAAQLLSRRPPAGWEKKEQMIAAASLSHDNSAISTLLSVVVLHSDAWELLMWIDDDRRSHSLRSQMTITDQRATVTSRLWGISE